MNRMAFLKMSLFVITLVVAASAAAAVVPTNTFKDPHYVPGHDVMVHLFEWKWSDIAVECERFLGPRGYGGVQVSPVQENVIISSRPWWERYQPISYQSTTRSGNEQEFREMVQKCNAAGVRIYVDIIINHMSADHPFHIVGTGNSSADPPSREYPAVPFSKNDFHDPCPLNNYNDPIEVRNCELVGLHDLDQASEYVRQKMVDLMNNIIEMGVAGFRIDAAKHMWPQDLNVIYSRLRNLNVDHGFRKDSRPYIYQEVIDMSGEGISKYEYNDLATVTEFKYGMEMSRAMRGNNPLKWYRNIGEPWGMLPHNDSLVFIDNHDNQRNHGGEESILNYKHSRLWIMAVAFMFAHPYGNPQIISSFAFEHFDQGPPADSQGNLISPFHTKYPMECTNGWVCEHRWRQIVNMVQWRNTVEKAEINQWWDNGNNQIAFGRGNTGFIAINADTCHLEQKLQTEMPSGHYCDIISGDFVNGNCSGKLVIIDVNGYANINIPLDAEDGIIAIHVNAKL